MKKISIFIISAILFSMLAVVGVSAASDPGMVIDFSDQPSFDGVSSQMDYNFVNDGDARVAVIEALEEKTDLYASFYPEDYTDSETINADTYQWVKFCIKNVSVCPIFEMHFAGTSTNGNVIAEACTHYKITSEDTEYKTYVYNIKDANKATFPVHPNANFSGFEDTSVWTGDVKTVRLDFGYIQESGGEAPEGINMYIKYIAFFDSEEAANAWEYKPMKTAADYQPKETEAPTTTEAPDTTESPTTTEAEVTQDNETTTGNSNDTADEGNNMAMWIVIAAAAVILIVVVIVIASSKGKKKS